MTTAAIVVHPHPGMGGDRNHPLVVAIADGLSADGIPAMRIDLPDPDPDVSTSALVEAVPSWLDEAGADEIVLVGYSWGSVVSAYATHPRLTARVLIAPPVSMLVAEPGGVTPTLALVPEHDQYGGLGPITDAMGAWPATTIEIVTGADHFLAGAISRVADRAVEWVRASRDA